VKRQLEDAEGVGCRRILPGFEPGRGPGAGCSSEALTARTHDYLPDPEGTIDAVRIAIQVRVARIAVLVAAENNVSAGVIQDAPQRQHVPFVVAVRADGEHGPVPVGEGAAGRMRGEVIA